MSGASSGAGSRPTERRTSGYTRGGSSYSHTRRATATFRAGKQVGADYLLFGDIASIVKRAGRDTDVYYKFTLNLVDVQTGIIEWTDEKEIRKEARRPIFGS